MIEQEGYEKLSIRKIATIIEYSPTTIYPYYKDKAGIITDMSDELYSNVLNDIVAIQNEDTELSIDNKIHEI
uniref:TetR/AcrR family transcriptional regulator n=1 Tax=Enterocloster aldenensis TaxID=358742 RepID=UPI00336A1EA2